MANDTQLINLYWTSAGIYPNTAEISPFDFRERVEAAGRAGFKGIGIWHTDLEYCLRQRSLQEMSAILDDNGIIYNEIEFLEDWFLDGEKRAASDQRKRLLLESYAALRGKHLKVGDFHNTPCPMPRLIDSFAALCREAEDYGAMVGFEFMASAMLHSLEDSLAMVEGAGAKNGGVIVDMAHVAALGVTYEAVAAIPPPHLISVELNDGALPGSPLYDPARARRYCGDGDYDIQGFIAAARQAGYTGPWAVEVFSPELVDLPLGESNTRAYTTAIAQFRP
jgi:sugar phosphate isomerase/epimerase